MKYEIIGVQHKEGVFTNDKGKTYDFNNYNFHCVGTDIHVIGQSVREVKIKAGDCIALFDAVGGKPESIIGHTVEFEFGSYGKVVNYAICE